PRKRFGAVCGDFSRRDGSDNLLHDRRRSAERHIALARGQTHWSTKSARQPAEIAALPPLFHCVKILLTFYVYGTNCRQTGECYRCRADFCGSFSAGRAFLGCPKRRANSPTPSTEASSAKLRCKAAIHRGGPPRCSIRQYGRDFPCAVRRRFWPHGRRVIYPTLYRTRSARHESN